MFVATKTRRFLDFSYTLVRREFIGFFLSSKLIIAARFFLDPQRAIATEASRKNSRFLARDRFPEINRSTRRSESPSSRIRIFRNLFLNTPVRWGSRGGGGERGLKVTRGTLRRVASSGKLIDAATAVNHFADNWFARYSFYLGFAVMFTGKCTCT